MMSASRVLVTSKTETGAERVDTCFRLGRGEAGGCVPSPMAGDLINCVYVMAPPIKPLRELLGHMRRQNCSVGEADPVGF